MTIAETNPSQPDDELPFRPNCDQLDLRGPSTGVLKMSDEQTSGRSVAGLVSILGWIAVLGGTALVIYGIYALMQSDFGLAAGGPLMAGGAVTIALGLLSIINATMARAMVDTANNTAKLLESGGVKTARANLPDTSDADLPDLPGIKKETYGDNPDIDVREVERMSTDIPGDARDDDIPHFEPVAPAPPPIVPDTSDPRGWPLAIDEFDLDGHLAMTLEDGSIGIETPHGWRRLRSVDEARAWLSQQ